MRQSPVRNSSRSCSANGGRLRRLSYSSVEPTPRTTAQAPVCHGGQPAAPFAQRGHVAEHPVAPGHPILPMILVQELGFEPGHVHVGRTFALAGLALQAEIEHFVHGRIGEPCQAQLPVIASRRALARPRVLCCSSRVAWYEGHIVPSRFLRHSPTPAHSSAARVRPPSAEKSKSSARRVSRKRDRNADWTSAAAHPRSCRD